MPASARRHDPEKLPVTRIRDLHYGDALFYYYQDKQFEALARLLAYDHWQRLPHHEEEAQLLMGSLYLQLGMHNEAGELFERLLTRDVPTGVRNRAWFYLAQVWYARGYLDKADAALRRINGRMSPDLEARKELLFANVLMHEGRFDEAIRLLSGWRGSSVWSAYARFNLGVALVRTQRLADAEAFLTGVGSMIADTSEMLALRDRADLALGFAFLQANQPAKALPALERVRLNGPYSDKALLGTGWAQAALGNYQGALTPWMELRNRNLLDAAVQESYLAVPYAFGKLNANAQAADYYERAIESFNTEDGRLDAAITRISQGDMLKRVLGADQERDGERAPRAGWFWQLKELPDAPESRYLYQVLAGHDFQEGLKNYRDMVFLQGTLAHWSDSMEAFQDMIDTRDRAYAERVPRAQALLASGAVDHLQQRDVGLQNELRDVMARHDVAALGTDAERAQWARVRRVEAALGGAPETSDNPELHERLSLVKGVLQMSLEDAWNARLWQVQRDLKDLDLTLREAQSRWIRVQRALRSMPANTGEFAARVASLKGRIAAIQVRIAATQEKQSAYLARIAVGELTDQKARLAAYQIQARFALASMYDRAASSENAAHPKAPAPVQKGDEPQSAAAPGPIPDAAPPAPVPQR
ncbi:MAG: tetratricopeptide repeat protein [Steroidobacterales bacterium]